jgi:hypothetical protein
MPAPTGPPQRQHNEEDPNKLMTAAVAKSRKYPTRMSFTMLLSYPHRLVQLLPFALRQYLHQASGGAWFSPVNQMPQPDQPEIRPFPGVHLHITTPRFMERAEMGGAFLSSNILQSPQKLTTAAIWTGSSIYYGQVSQPCKPHRVLFATECCRAPYDLMCTDPPCLHMQLLGPSPTALLCLMV